MNAFGLVAYAELMLLCFAILLALLITACLRGKISGNKNNIFLIGTYISYLAVLLCETTYQMADYFMPQPAVLLFVTETIWIAVFACASIFWYLSCETENGGFIVKKKHAVLLCFFPALLGVVFAATSPFHLLLFFVNAEGLYERGMMFKILCFAFFLYVFIAALSGIIRFGLEKQSRHNLLLFVYSMIILSCGLAQTFSGFPLGCVGFTSALLGHYLETIVEFNTKRENRFNEMISEARLATEANRASDESFQKTRLLDRLKVLLVDDMELSLEISKDVLEAEGANVTCAITGEDALIAIKSNRFDVVLMDVNMPGMDGIETTKKLIEYYNPRGTDVPVIGMSSVQSKEQIERIKAAGAYGYLGKPLVAFEVYKIFLSYMREHSAKIERKLRDTIKLANTDALTSVKNIAAYTDKISELSTELSENPGFKLGIVMCDIDGLKTENDTYGHDVGDIYIKNCSKLLCEVFSHSPVYRIGGDEFVVILQGRDYANADKLLFKIKKEMTVTAKIPTSEEGKASMSIGLAIYNRRRDKHISDVVKRADSEMYIDKRKNKEKPDKEEND